MSYETNNLGRSDFGRSDQADDQTGAGGAFNDSEPSYQQVPGGGKGEYTTATTDLNSGYGNQGGAQDRTRDDESSPQTGFSANTSGTASEPQNYGYGQGSTGGGSEEDIYGSSAGGNTADSRQRGAGSEEDTGSYGASAGDDTPIDSRQREAGSAQSGKPSLTDKIRGTVEKAAGGVTGNQGKVAHGEARKRGEF